jgi:hypothetical protein
MGNILLIVLIRLILVIMLILIILTILVIFTPCGYAVFLENTGHSQMQVTPHILVCNILIS